MSISVFITNHLKAQSVAEIHRFTNDESKYRVHFLTVPVYPGINGANEQMSEIRQTHFTHQQQR